MNRPTVLVVDDDPQHRDISVTILRHHGYRTLEAKTGEDAIRMATERQPDLILMDVRLPGGIDGWTATERLKSDARTSAIPIVMFTARALMEDQARSAWAGADAYLAKPISPTAIVEEVKRWVRPE